MKKKIKICIVKSDYNDTSKLLQSAVKELKKRKIHFKILEVPGAFEIPVVVARNINKYDGFIAIASIIKGETPNFNFIQKTYRKCSSDLSKQKTSKSKRFKGL